MEAHVDPEARVSSKDVDRLGRGMRGGSPREQVVARLDDIATSIDGDGVSVTVHFTKTQGAPVRYEADESVPTAAVRELDLQRKFHGSAADLAQAAGLTGPRAHALRCHLGIDADPAFYHDFRLRQVPTPPLFGQRVQEDAGCGRYPGYGRRMERAPTPGRHGAVLLLRH